MHTFVSAKEWMVRVPVRIAVFASVSAACALAPVPSLAGGQPPRAAPSSVQLTVFERSAGSGADSVAFVLTPSVRFEREQRNASGARYPEAGDAVLESMLDGFSASRADSSTSGAQLQSFAGGRSSDSFLIVPQWMRTGLRPASFAPALPLAIGSCGLRSSRPSTLLRPSAEARRRALFPLVQQAACQAGLPVSLMDAMLVQESGYNPWALSSKGAFGLGQLMPGTARYLGVDRYDIRGNLNGAARYLREHLTEFGDARLALAAYNAGPGRVRRSRGVPNITETKDYVRSILKNWSVLENNESTMSWQKH